MGAEEHANQAAVNLPFGVGLHDASAGLAVGIGLLRTSKEFGQAERGQDPFGPIQVFEEVLANLRQLSRGISDRTPQRQPQQNLRDSLKHEARLVGVDLELEMIGLAGWLTPDQAELLRLAGREAIRNVKRHAGAASCRMIVDLSACPFVLWARDWGAGIRPGSRVGNGIVTLRALAASMGCELVIGSQPGLGTELVLTGPRCPRTWTAPSGSEAGNSRLRSGVAKESPSSRKRVAARRPFGTSERQIT